MSDETQNNTKPVAPETKIRAAVQTASKFNRWLAIMAGVAILGIAILIVANVLLRYFTGKAIIGAEEIVQVTMVPVIFLAIGYCGQIGGHISVDILEPFLPQWFWRIVDPIVRTVGAVAFAAMCWQAIQSGIMAGEFNETTNIRRIPHQPMWFMLALGAGFAGIIELTKLWKTPGSTLVIEDKNDDH
ncbi:TRAP transporter small permease [Shimia sp.]|uniref:TRAP transporter small permease n=1 Tax=Shimia sp. TaxID=1954381 RepID=UPI00329A770B